MTSTRAVAAHDRSCGEIAGAILHQLRTPLTALIGEVELALRRPRSADYYQEAFARVAERTAELLDMTADLAFIESELRADQDEMHATTSLGVAFAHLEGRFARRPTARVTVEPVLDERSIVGDAPLVMGALALLIELAVRTRHDGARVHVRAVALPGGAAAGTWIDVEIGAEPEGLWPIDTGSGRGVVSANQLAFGAAARALERCGGAADRIAAPEGDRLRVRLRRAARPGE